MNDDTVQWLLASDEPWTRYRTLVDLLGWPEDHPEVTAARSAMLAHPQVQRLQDEAAAWPSPALRRHNDAAHPIYKLSTLADMGLRAADPGMQAPLEAILAHPSPDGAFQSILNVSAAYGGAGEDTWTWVLCDAPTLLYTLLAMGLRDEDPVQRAVAHLVSLADENGWRCRCGPDMGRFRGPGRKGDPCPIANVFALKALALVPELASSAAVRAGIEMLLWHWEHRAEVKPYLFGAGTDYRKLKYPFVWYDILHVLEVLSRFQFVYGDDRFAEMVSVVTAQADEQGCFAASSMYQAWKGWSFADKKRPSPWLTFLVLRILRRLA